MCLTHDCLFDVPTIAKQEVLSSFVETRLPMMYKLVLLAGELAARTSLECLAESPWFMVGLKIMHAKEALTNLVHLSAQ